MKVILVQQRLSAAGVCPYRLLNECRQEISWANSFLDAQQIRQLSPRSLRAYAYDLLHFARWIQTKRKALSEITESTLADYVRQQLNQQPRPTPQTINHRLTVIRCLYRFHHGQEIPAGKSHFQRSHTTRCPLGFGRPRRTIAFGLRLKEPRHIVQPLSVEQVAKFWASFRTFRDLAIVGLMLLDGLRSCEILSLQLEDLRPVDALLHVLGKECHSYCISLRPRHETTGTHVCRPACNLAFSSANVLLAVRKGIGLGPCTDALGAGRVEPMSEPYPV
jgi:hypothetical protein